MFGFADLADALPKLQKLAETVEKDFAELVAEQKRQGELVNLIAEKLGVEKEQ